MNYISNHSKSASCQNEVTVSGPHSAAFLAPELPFPISAYKAVKPHGELHVPAESKDLPIGVSTAGGGVVHPQKALARIYFLLFINAFNRNC